MDKKVKNFILYGLLCLIVFSITLLPWFGKHILWKEENNRTVPFSGIYFDSPTNISNLKIRRSETEGLVGNLISYDVEFEYKGVDSSMRIMGKLAEHAFFGDSIFPKHSKATIKGEYDKINNILFDEKINYGSLYKNIENYKFISNSEIRVPLSENIKNYKFRLSYAPKELIYAEDIKLNKLSVFLTNARVDNFIDGEYINESETQSFNESGMYVNVLEIFDANKISSITFWKNVNNVVFLLSIILVLLLIWIDKISNPLMIIVPMLISILTVFRFLEIGVSVKAAMVVFPVLGILTVLFGKLISRDKLIFNKYDLPQSLLGGIFIFVIGMLLYLVPKLV